MNPRRRMCGDIRRLPMLSGAPVERKSNCQNGEQCKCQRRFQYQPVHSVSIAPELGQREAELTEHESGGPRVFCFAIRKMNCSTHSLARTVLDRRCSEQ